MMLKKILHSLSHAGVEVDEHTTAMIGYWDENLICRYANTAYLDWFGIHPADMIDKMHIKTLLGPLYEANELYIQGALAGSVQIFRREILSPYGQPRQSIAIYLPVVENEAGKGFYVHVEEANARKNTPLTAATHPTAKYLASSDVVAELEKLLHSFLLTRFPGIAQLAKQLFISETKLKQSFKARHGKSIFAYYRFLQMELAEAYLNEKRATKKQLAAMFNFTNSTNFIICYQKHLKEKSRQKIVEELTKANDDRYKIFVTQSPFAIAMLDIQMNIRAASQKFIDDHHLNDKPVIGANYYELFPAVGQKWKRLHKAALRGKPQKGEDDVFESHIGSIIYIRWDIRPWRDHDGNIGGLMLFTEDITAQKLKEQENAKIIDILNSTSPVIKIGVWKRNFVTGTNFWNNATKAILEVPENTEAPPEPAFEYYKNPKSRHRIETATRLAIEKGLPFDIKAEIVTARGNRKLVRVVGYPEFKNGKCARLFGIFQELKLFPRNTISFPPT